MDVYMKVYAKRNPELAVLCAGCDQKFYEDTMKVFSAGDSYVATCPNCGATTELTNLEEAASQIVKQLKDLGIEFV